MTNSKQGVLITSVRFDLVLLSGVGWWGGGPDPGSQMTKNLLAKSISQWVLPNIDSR